MPHHQKLTNWRRQWCFHSRLIHACCTKRHSEIRWLHYCWSSRLLRHHQYVYALFCRSIPQSVAGLICRIHFLSSAVTWSGASSPHIATTEGSSDKDKSLGFSFFARKSCSISYNRFRHFRLKCLLKYSTVSFSWTFTRYALFRHVINRTNTFRIVARNNGVSHRLPINSERPHLSHGNQHRVIYIFCGAK